MMDPVVVNVALWFLGALTGIVAYELIEDLRS